ncbi:hypothetical protein AcW1_009415 [Taiwanofungus camphoratus]|nr:hypothetical protein AcW1_009415 [Antrodia cinnamomea]
MSRDASKRPSGGRPLPRRLFSIDSLRREKSGSESDASSLASATGKRSPAPSYISITPKPVQTANEKEPDPLRNATATGTEWTDKTIIQSPQGLDGQRFPDREGEAKVKIHAPKPIPLDLSKTKGTLAGLVAEEDTTQPLSPSRRRWNTVRAHVLPSLASGQSTPQLPAQRIESPGLGTPPSSRPQTPKSYRFGQKKIFRQVVEQAREVAVDESRRLEEILRACWAARFGEMSVRPKTEREASQATVASSLHLPFMSSTTSLPMASSTSVLTMQATHRSGLRRPPSSQAMVQESRATPSVTYIARVLALGTSANRLRTLPYETQVLSALLVPFLGPFRGDQIGLEQQTAVETFESAVRTWKSPSSEVELDRCLWCCNAASVPSSSRIRILGVLSSLLFSRDKTFEAETPIILRTLLQGLFSLLLSLMPSPSYGPEAESLRAYISAIQDGQCGTPSPQSLEKEYGVRLSKPDDNAKVRSIITLESLIGCLEIGSENSRRLTLCNLLEEYWPLPEQSLILTPLLSCMHSHKLKMFISSALALLSSSPKDAVTRLADADVIVRILRTRIFPEVEALSEKDSMEARGRAVKLVLELMCIQNGGEHEYLVVQFCHWYQDTQTWKSSIENTIRDVVTNTEWLDILRLLPTIVKYMPEVVQKPMISYMVPLLYDRLVVNSPAYPCQALSDFLEKLSRVHPKVFFKPIFTCAASGKDLTITNQLCILTVVAKYLPDFWSRDPEMMAVALMSNTTSMKSASGGEGPIWGKTQVGQSVLLVELIEYLRAVRKMKDVAITASSVKFVIALEARLGILIEATEHTVHVPMSQRPLYCALFREIRLLTRSLKPASWLPSVVSWVTHEPPRNREFHRASSDEGVEEHTNTLHKMHALYTQAYDVLRGGHKRRTTMFVSPVINTQQSSNTSFDEAYDDMLSGRVALLDSMHEGLKSTALPLLVLVSGLLTPGHYMSLGPTLWDQCVDGVVSMDVVAPACFLIMQCAEKSPDKFLRIVESDLYSTDAKVRRRAIQNIATISGWRFQILSQDVILDRTHRRPFKLARPPIMFVPTDMGTSVFVLEDDSYEFKDSRGNVLPLELRRRLSEIGWEQEDRVLDPKTQWIKTPMSLLPSQQLETLDTSFDDTSSLAETLSGSPSPEPSPTNSPSGDLSLLRRDSSTGGRSRGAKRRPVFVSTLLSLFPNLVSMVKDDDFTVASTAKSLIVDFMRDDPTLLSRTVFDLISGDERSVISAVSTVRTYLHIQYVLPPGMAHHILNHLAGFLKSSLRQAENVHPLQNYAYSVPAIAKLVTQVSKMSLREIRRAKVDIFLTPSGALWFPPSAPAGPMFPRGLMDMQNPFDALPLAWITLIRTSQNLLFLQMLKRDPQDIKVIRKNMTRLVLPSRSDNTDQGFLPFTAFMPCRPNQNATASVDATVVSLSLTLSRSYLLLVSQMFRSMPRHLNNRQELATFMDGINRILLAHGDDIGVVGQAMLALMLASTRFKRMFISGGGYALFMPAVIKVYAEAESHQGIRSAIEYAVNRFYALHQESFVFQSFDVVSHMFVSPDVDSAWLAGNVFALFSTLKNGAPPSGPDVAGIYDLNKVQEQENLMVIVAEEVPQTFLASLRKNRADRNQVTLELPEHYEWKRLKLDNLVRLFLTVIAHNPGVQRAERFLRFLRLLAPQLYHASSSARDVLREGIDALGSILLSRGAGKAKPSDNAQVRPPDDFSYEVFVEGSGSGSQQALSPGDIMGMRFDYLSLVTSFTGAGGRLGPGAPQRVLELVKLILKDSITAGDRIATFLTDYMRTVLLHDSNSGSPPSLKDVTSLLTDLSPIVSAYCSSVNFSGVFEVIETLSGNTVFASQPAFAKLVVTRYCGAGLEACEVAASENWLLSLPSRSRIIALMNCAVPLTGADVFFELEKHEPSYEFLVGVVLPFALTMKTSAEITADSQWTDTWRRDIYSKAWVRLLSYTLSACENPDVPGERSKSSSGSIRRKSQDSRSSVSSPKPAMAFTIAMQILKVIIIRAEEDLSATWPSVWFRVASALKSLLSDGDAMFAFGSRTYSDPSSPVQSPRMASFSSQQDNPFLLPSSISLQSLKRLSPPRLIDYMTWSFIQWLCLRRNPLVIQMRVFIQEKVAALHQDLMRQNPATSPAGVTPARSRRLSSAFTKPRRSMINENTTSSAASTPRNSAFLNTSLSLPTFDDFSLHASTPRKDEGMRQAGYARQVSPISSGRGLRDSGPKIVHLGPVRPSSSFGETIAPRSLSPSGAGARGRARNALAGAKDALVTSPVLVRTTYRRIRLAQTVLGYSTLLPLGDSAEDEDADDAAVRAWTRKDALEAVLQEVKDLMEEFREDYTDVGEESGVLVDVEDVGQSFSLES